MSEGRRWGSGHVVLCDLVSVQCNAMSPGRDLSQCSGAFECLPAPDTFPYCTRIRRIQAVQEIGCNRYAVTLRKNLTVKSRLFMLQNGQMRDPSPPFTGELNRLCVHRGEMRPSLSPPRGKCADRSQGRTVKQPNKGGMLQWSF